MPASPSVPRSLSVSRQRYRGTEVFRLPVRENVDNCFERGGYLAHVIVRRVLPALRGDPVCGESQVPRYPERARQMEILRHDSERANEKDVACAIHTAVGIEAGVVEKNVLRPNARINQIFAHGGHLVVRECAVVSRDEYLGNFSRFVERDRGISAVGKNGRRNPTPHRCSQDESDFRLRHIRDGGERDGCDREAHGKRYHHGDGGERESGDDDKPVVCTYETKREFYLSIPNRKAPPRLTWRRFMHYRLLARTSLCVPDPPHIGSSRHSAPAGALFGRGHLFPHCERVAETKIEIGRVN